jgi:hypothetical protein
MEGDDTISINRLENTLANEIDDGLMTENTTKTTTRRPPVAKTHDDPGDVNTLFRATISADTAENGGSRDGESNPGPIHYELSSHPALV